MSFVIVIDDQATNREILKRLAVSLGADVTVETFDDAAAALTRVYERAPDLIVTDLKMPGMSGIDLIDAVRGRASCHDVPIVVVTAYEDRHLRYDALEHGASDILVAPVDWIEFRARAQNMLELSGRRHDLAAVADGRGMIALQALEGASEPVIVFDAQGRVSIVSAGARRLFGVPAADVRATGTEAALPADLVARARDAWSGASGARNDMRIEPFEGGAAVWLRGGVVGPIACVGDLTRVGS